MQRHLELISETPYAKHLGVAANMTVEEFRRSVPLSDYADLEPWFSKVAAGDQHSVFATGVHVEMLSLTSGTTGNRKLLPVTNHHRESLKRSWYYWGAAFYRDHPQLLQYPILQLTSNWQQGRTSGGFPFGDLSGYLAHIQPWYIRHFYYLPEEVTLIEHQVIKYYTYLRLLLEKDIHFISTATPATFVSIADWADLWKEDLLRDLRDGTFKYRSEVPKEVLTASKSLNRRCSSKRFKQLDKIANDQTKKFWPRYFWPNLEALAMWTGGTMARFKPAVQERYGATHLRDLGYIASEGFLAISVGLSTMLNIQDYFFEFQSVATGELRLAHELEIGAAYHVLITSLGGLVRYKMHDVVRCESYVGQLPFINFIHKAMHVSDLTGEKLTAFHVANALEKASFGQLIDTERAVLVPYATPHAHYCLYMEHNSNLDVAVVASVVDELLGEENFMYAEHREAGKILPLTVRWLHHDTLQRLHDRILRRSKGSLEQYKHPCLILQGDDIVFLEHNSLVEAMGTRR